MAAVLLYNTCMFKPSQVYFSYCNQISFIIIIQIPQIFLPSPTD